jgi:hypothetical protein
MRRLALVLAAAFIVAAPLTAQTDVGPKAGSWGGEACFQCGASLMHFRDPNSAWLLGVNAFYAQTHTDLSGPISGPSARDSKGFSVNVQPGIRFYRPVENRLRSFLGLGAVLGFNGGGSSHGYRYGVSSEMGAAYFFTPHLSLGVAGTVSATAEHLRESDGGFSQTQRSFLAGFNGFQLLGAVYF